MTMQPVCDICGDPTDGYVCRRDTDETARYLRLVELAPEVETNVARLARYASRGGRRAADPYPDHAPDIPTPQTRPETFAWAASREQPERNALRPEPLPVELNASERAAVAFTAVTTWARTVEDDRGAPIPDVQPGGHPAAVAARYLLEQLPWLRHQPFAAEAFDQLKAAGAVIQRIVDSPPEQEIVGICDCGEHLYAYKGAATVTCHGCRLRWDVQTSRENLREALRGRLVTASEAGLFLAFFGITGDRRRSAKTVTMWALRGLLVAHGRDLDGWPLFLFGEVIDRATRQGQVPLVVP
jgi:hypothetical protein